MTPHLFAQLHAQAKRYGELMVTPTELDDLMRWLTTRPHAAFEVGPGRVVPIRSLTLKVLHAP